MKNFFFLLSGKKILSTYQIQSHPLFRHPTKPIALPSTQLSQEQKTALSGITTVTFDIDNTLCDFKKTISIATEKTVIEIKKRHSKVFQFLNSEKITQVREQIATQYPNLTLEEIRYQSFAQLFAEANIIDPKEIDYIYHFYMEKRYQDMIVYEDVIPNLKKLRKSGYKLGIISNGNSYLSRNWLDSNLFDFAIFSQEHQTKKPESKIFQLAIAKSGCSSKALLHVGDHLIQDIDGANQAGIYSCWLNRTKQAPHVTIQPTIEISNLYQLTQILLEQSLAKNQSPTIQSAL